LKKKNLSEFSLKVLIIYWNVIRRLVYNSALYIIHDLEIYGGKGTIKSTSNLGLSGDIVLRLSDIIPKHKNYKPSFDNWFTSYNLMLNLKNLGILSVGSVRSNRIAGYQFENDIHLKKVGRRSLIQQLILPMVL
jgi:hypothetical protein